LGTNLVRASGHPVPPEYSASSPQSYGIARGQLAYYRPLEQQGHARIIAELAGLNRHVAEWEAWAAGVASQAAPVPAAAPPLGFVISMEGADPILEPDQLPQWWEAGLRLLGLD